ncbi:NACHT domain-containing NTPase [Calothrix membranacea FACHB-236]|nr:NACHT domain-containing NTPase [Calothrix membranacea FACHB-236]
MTRSLRASKVGLEKAQKAYKLKGWAQQYLAGGVGCTRQVVGKFFKGQNIDKSFFQTICTELGLEWRDIAELEDGEEQAVKNPNIDALVQEVREKLSPYIQKQCGWMRVLDMTQPIGLNDIYTDVNILEKITGRRPLEIAELLKNCKPEDFERVGLSQVVEKRVPGLEAVERYPKLMILGKPGAGKTTFLKRIAIQCNLGNFLGDHVPIFIMLKAFAEEPDQPGLLQYINDQFAQNEILDQHIIKTLLRQGRTIVLLDGLDEVKQVDNGRVIREIERFTTQYYSNYFVTTCRIAANEYKFEHFSEVEVSDFDEKQIAEFATKWYQTKDPKKAQQFVEKLEQNPPIKELGTNPLLLTLLCLLFEDSTDFPSSRSDLYEEGVYILLKKWDGTRRIERDQVYHKLSLKHKQHLLSKIALETFEKGNYFFKETDAEEYISNYIKNLPDAQTETEALLLESKAVLKSIEAQHGLLIERAWRIYSFSHLTFHEFFAAKQITLNCNSQQVFQKLDSHITDKHWREVFLLSVGMLGDADDFFLLMKHRIDDLVATDEKLQQFLRWVEEKSSSVDSPYKSTAVRSVYFRLANRASVGSMYSFDRNIYIFESPLALALDSTLAFGGDDAFPLTFGLTNFSQRFLTFSIAYNCNLKTIGTSSLDLNLDFYLETTLQNSIDIDLDDDLQFRHYLERIRNLDCDLELSVELRRSLQHLKGQPPEVNDEQAFKNWWQKNGQTWAAKLRAVMIKHRNISHDWQFSKFQNNLLNRYYDANLLLIDCLNSECYVSREVRQQIEDTLLLPQSTLNASKS